MKLIVNGQELLIAGPSILMEFVIDEGGERFDGGVTMVVRGGRVALNAPPVENGAALDIICKHGGIDCYANGTGTSAVRITGPEPYCGDFGITVNDNPKSDKPDAVVSPNLVFGS